MRKRNPGENSFEFHKLSIQKAASNWPTALKLAQRNIVSMRNSGSFPERHLKRLESLLREGPDVCAYVLLSHTKGSRELRECSMFSGILDEEG